MKCEIARENRKLKKENKILKDDVNDLRNTVKELMQNFGKDEDNDEGKGQ